MCRPPPSSTLFPYTTLFRSAQNRIQTMMLIHEKLYQSSESLDQIDFHDYAADLFKLLLAAYGFEDRKSTRLNSSHSQISYAVFCLKKKTAMKATDRLDLSCR